MNDIDTPDTSVAADPDSGQAWAASLFARQPAPNAETGSQAGDDETPDVSSPDPDHSVGPGAEGMPAPVDLTTLAALSRQTDHDDSGEDAAPRHAGQAKVWWAGVLVTITVVFSVVAALMVGLTREEAPVADKKAEVPVLAVGAPTVEPTPPPEAGNDLIPYMASGDPQQTGCYEGSTSPGALQETDSESAWVCVRGFGSAGGGTNGQKLEITLGNEMTGPAWYLVSKVEVTAGWVPKVPGGRDEWSQHRVPTKIRVVFNDSTDPSRPPTSWDIDTRGARGPVPYSGARPVLASHITVVILETMRPPADDTATDGTITSTSPTPFFPELTTPTTAPTEDPENPMAVDATFAMSLLQFEGKRP
ncbi:hypothetical protein [Mycolicibacterium mageritense]|uniref:hypothetical protein n=1 Tax=Mycolicibacterium mageritense TaxID=53462 RepID=UPI0011D6A8DB|nr:hypothetical protein [Mycolicibacterium mageritense]TXI56451.1 MAG: hypothetical protein E6Q55_28715 [Mycolicibacterium mageritense]